MQLIGEGNNGKTTWFNVLTTAFPEWVKSIEPDHLYAGGRQTDANAPKPWFMDVMGARHVVCEEGDAVHKTPSVNESFKFKISSYKYSLESPLTVGRFQRVLDLHVTQWLHCDLVVSN